MKPVCLTDVYQHPHKNYKPAPGPGPAQLCALAWARSNFPAGDNSEICEVYRDGLTVNVITTSEHASFTFRNELDAHRALKQLPVPVECSNPFLLASGCNAEELEREMNFGSGPDEEPMVFPAEGFVFGCQ